MEGEGAGAELEMSVSNIAMVKKDKARKVEDMLIMNAQRGAIGGQIDEAQLIEMLESINEQTEKETKVSRLLPPVPASSLRGR